MWICSPTAATSQDISQLIQAHVEAARHACRAGFDGVELHAANGYLLQQLLGPCLEPPHRRVRRNAAPPGAVHRRGLRGRLR
ncbi:hypothetical protein [Lentzea sp.]|uniref:oxidoreductase n=1 Tax=Lentzea sp. TaxID=56099 RepID=UPI002B537096|nr:hypothetical protein [Lentzea sp.]HUQ54808.1 hypothetical protein [Lentzea sp.]